MNLSNTQLITLYDSEPSMSVETLAQATGYDVTSVKMILTAGSVRYKQENSEDPDLFTTEDRIVAAQGIKELAAYSTIEAVKLKACQSILDRDKKGEDKKFKAAKAMGQININILSEHLFKSRKAIQAAKGEVINV